MATTRTTPPQPDQLTHAVLMCQGTFDKPGQDWSAAAADIGGSGFGTVELGQWHVHSDGSIYYNETPLAEVQGYLGDVVQAIKAPGRVGRVLLQFGPYSDDFAGIQSNLVAFKQAMGDLVSSAGLDGFDWDLEQKYHGFESLIADITQWAAAKGLTVAAAPYTDIDFWASVLKVTNGGGKKGFAWWNLQNGPVIFSQWKSQLAGIVPYPEAFLVPQYSLLTGEAVAGSADALYQSLVQLYAEFPGCDGAAVWRYEDLNRTTPPSTAAGYAQAIASALSTV